MNKADMVQGESYFVENNDGINQKDDILIYLNGKTKPQFLNLTAKLMTFCKLDNISCLELNIGAMQDKDNIIVKGNGGGSESPAISSEFPQDAENNEYRYICPDWLNEIAIGLTAGAIKYPGETWRGIPCDEHLARALRHINLYRLGDRSENHLINAAMRIMMAFVTQEGDK